MGQVTLKGKTTHTSGPLPLLKTQAPYFELVSGDLEEKTLESFGANYKLLATLPSLDTGVCGMMAKHLSKLSKKYPELQLIVVSADLPFAQKRFCQAEQIDNLTTLSMMRNKEFGQSYGVLLTDGPLAGLLARAVFILNKTNKLVYAQLVPEITQEPDYEKVTHALESLKSTVS